VIEVIGECSSRELVNIGRIDSGLQAAGRKHFGSWRNALAAAGVKRDKGRCVESGTNNG
jgi:hypothetical protein